MEKNNERGDELNWLRQKIDKCDAQIVKLLDWRFELVRRVGLYKASRGLPVLDEAREAELIADRRRRASPGDSHQIEEIFRVILAQSRRLQEESRGKPKERG